MEVNESNGNNGNKRKKVSTKFEVWESIYNWDEQAVDFYEDATFATREEAEKKVKEYVPEESDSSDKFIVRCLSEGYLIITDKKNDKKVTLPKEKMRLLSKEEIEFIRGLEKSIRPSNYEIGKNLIEIFGEPKIQSYHMQYCGPSNFWPKSEEYGDGNCILIEYDIESGNAYASTEQRFLEERMEEKEVNIIDIAQLGAQIGMEAKEQTLPNGKVVNSLVWDQENLLKAVKAVEYMSHEGKPVRITGVAPAWLVSALTHTVHPCPVSVYMPQIGKYVDIPKLAHGEANSEGEAAFKVTEKGDSVLVEYNMDLPDGITTYDEGNLPKVVVPEIAQGKAVFLSGKGPNYLTVAIAEAYAHVNSSVSLFQPGVGYTCSITHSRAKKLGDLTKDPLGIEGVKEQLATRNEGPTID